jgi:hypothetical protein
MNITNFEKVIKIFQMDSSEILHEITRLPLRKRIYVIEKAIKSIREQEELSRMEEAANVLLKDYQSDYELTAFTNIDFLSVK